MPANSIVTSPPWQDTVGLKTLSPSGTPPRSRIEDPAHAQQIVQMAIEANRDRARKEAMVKGMFDGNAPFAAAKLKSAGRGWEANFNTLEGKARKSAAKVPYYDIFSGSKTYIDVTSSYGTASEAADYSGIITEELDIPLKAWIGFDFNMNTMLDDFIGFGQGFLVAPNPWSWRFKKVSKTRVLVLDGTECDVEEGLEVFIVREKMLQSQLYKYLKSGDSGWDKKAVIEAIRGAQPDTEMDPWQDPVRIQQRLSDLDIYVTSRAATVNVARLYVKEFDGRITECIILESGYSEDKEKRPAFLYRKVGRYGSFPEVFAPFFFEMDDGSWHGANGLGKDIFAIMQTLDRVTCQKINATFMRLALILQAKTPSAMQKAALQTIGNAIVVPPDVMIQNSQVLGDIGTAIEVGRDLADMVDSNTGIYRPRIEKPPGNPETATGAQLRFGLSNVLNSSAVNRFLLQLDRYYQELYRRIIKPTQHGNDPASQAARDFQERVTARGVPREALEQTRRVCATRTIGNGSMIMRQQALAALAPFLPQLGERGRQNFLNRIISAYTDQSMVEELNPIEDQQNVPSDHTNEAMLENGVMKTGGPVTWTPTQNNLIHAQTHLQAMAQAAGSLQQGADKVAVYNFLELSGPHVQQHLQALAQDPTRKGAVAALSKQWQAVAKVADKLGQQIQQDAQNQQRAQAIQSGMDPEIQLEAAKLKSDMEMKQAKQQHNMALKNAQTQQKMGIEKAKAMQDMALKDAQTASEIRRANVQQMQEPKTTE